jgi:anti-sigma B factor antagonist
MLFPSEVIANIYTPLHAVSVIELHGEITAFSEGKLIDAYLQVNEAGSRVIILNFKSLKYMNSSGIGLLIMLLVRANRSGQKLVVTDLDEHYQKIFELTHLDEAFQIYTSTEEALNNLVQMEKPYKALEYRPSLA